MNETNEINNRAIFDQAVEAATTNFPNTPVVLLWVSDDEQQGSNATTMVCGPPLDVLNAFGNFVLLMASVEEYRPMVLEILAKILVMSPIQLPPSTLSDMPSLNHPPH